jgi:hypothetical protein
MYCPGYEFFPGPALSDNKNVQWGCGSHPDPFTHSLDARALSNYFAVAFPDLQKELLQFIFFFEEPLMRPRIVYRDSREIAEGREQIDRRFAQPPYRHGMIRIEQTDYPTGGFERRT